MHYLLELYGDAAISYIMTGTMIMVFISILLKVCI